MSEIVSDVTLLPSIVHTIPFASLNTRRTSLPRTAAITSPGTETPSARRTVTVLPADAAPILFLTGSQSFCEATVTASVICPSDTVTLPLTLPPFPVPSVLSFPLSDESVPGVSVSGVSVLPGVSVSSGVSPDVTSTISSQFLTRRQVTASSEVPSGCA